MSCFQPFRVIALFVYIHIPLKQIKRNPIKNVMSGDLMLKPSCGGCGSTVELYGSSCKHLTLCVSCGKTLAENQGKCIECGATIRKLIREYNVRACSGTDKSYFIGRFMNGLPKFSKKKNADNKWSFQKEGLQGRQISDALRARCKNKPWVLEDESGQSQYTGLLEGTQSATYYLLMPQGKEFVAIPTGSWYNFNKVAQYKQLTLEEAEEKMKNRRKTADGYERWMMKAANNGAAAFGEYEKVDVKDTGVSTGGRGRKRTDDDDEANASDNGDEDEEEESKRKSRLGLNKKRGGRVDDEEGQRGGDLDIDDDDIEKGDDWEHEDIFTDDDEAVGNDPEERDLAPEIPPPPEIKQDEEDEDETNEEEGGLSKSGKELQKLLGRTGGLDESEPEDDDDDEDDVEDDMDASHILNPRQKDLIKQENTDNNNSLLRKSTSASASTSKLAKGKRKMNVADPNPKPSNAVTPKKLKEENDMKPVKDEPVSTSKSGVPVNGSSSSAIAGPVTEDDIRAVLLQKTSVTTQNLVDKFKPKLRTKEDKAAFTAILKRISRIHKAQNGSCYIVLREK